MTMISAITAHSSSETGCPRDTAAASLFHALADPSRLRILCHLRLGEHRVADLVAHLGLAQSTVSQHIACLRDCGLLTSRTSGRSTLYSLVDPERVAGLLAAADDLLEVSGEGVLRCRLNQAG